MQNCSCVKSSKIVAIKTSSEERFHVKAITVVCTKCISRIHIVLRKCLTKGHLGALVACEAISNSSQKSSRILPPVPDLSFTLRNPATIFPQSVQDHSHPLPQVHPISCLCQSAGRSEVGRGLLGESGAAVEGTHLSVRGDEGPARQPEKARGRPSLSQLSHPGAASEVEGPASWGGSSAPSFAEVVKFGAAPSSSEKRPSPSARFTKEPKVCFMPLPTDTFFRGDLPVALVGQGGQSMSLVILDDWFLF
jgi:hypothetical protein